MTHLVTADGKADPHIGRRVQVPAYTDAWMKGDRYGEVARVFEARCGVHMFRVRLDKSNHLHNFVAADCAVIP